MRLEFMKSVASSPFLLPIVAMLSVLSWIFVHPDSVGWNDCLWGLLIAAVTVYLTTELNNRNLLLRINSRMIASVLSVLLAVYIPFHSFGFAHVAMLLSLLTYFPLFFMYRGEFPTLTFLTYLLISIISTQFHVFLLIVPLYWIIQIIMGSFTFRAFSASVLGTLLPYWVMVGVMSIGGNYEQVVEFINGFIDWEWGGFTGLNDERIIQLVLAGCLFFVGTIDFLVNSFLDKTRVRTIYYIVIAHGVSVLAFLLLQLQNFEILYPIFLIDSAIVGGHYLAQSYGKIAHVFALIFLISLIATLVACI